MSKLICARCGASPAPGLPVVAGDTHYILHVREKEARKTEGRHVRATSCGKWIEAGNGHE